MPTGCSYLAGPLGLHLTHDVCQVETTVRVLPGSLANHLDGLNVGHRRSAQEGDQLGDRGNTEDLDPLDQTRVARLAYRHNHPREASLLSCQRRRQNAAYWSHTTIQPELTEQDCAAELPGSKDPLSGEHRSDDGEVEQQSKTDLKRPDPGMGLS